LREYIACSAAEEAERLNQLAIARGTKPRGQKEIAERMARIEGTGKAKTSILNGVVNQTKEGAAFTKWPVLGEALGKDLVAAHAAAQTWQSTPEGEQWLASAYVQGAEARRARAGQGLRDAIAEIMGTTEHVDDSVLAKARAEARRDPALAQRGKLPWLADIRRWQKDFDASLHDRHVSPNRRDAWIGPKRRQRSKPASQ